MDHELPFNATTAMPAPPHLRNRASTERWMDAQLAQSFPASDPPSWSLGMAKSHQSGDPLAGPSA